MTTRDSDSDTDAQTVLALISSIRDSSQSRHDSFVSECRGRDSLILGEIREVRQLLEARDTATAGRVATCNTRFERLEGWRGRVIGGVAGVSLTISAIVGAVTFFSSPPVAKTIPVLTHIRGGP